MFTEGDYGDKFYIILQGSVSVLDHSEEYLKQKQAEKHKKAMEKAAQQAKKNHDQFLHQIHSPKNGPNRKQSNSQLKSNEKAVRPTTAKQGSKSH